MELKNNVFTADSPQNFIIDSAAVGYGLTYDATSDSYSVAGYYGASSGGVVVDIEKKYRTIAVDGAYLGNVKGLQVLDTCAVTATANLKEITYNNMALMLNDTSQPGDGVNDSANAQVIAGSVDVPDANYIDSLVVVGKYKGTDKVVVFELKNTLVTSGAKVEMKDKNEVVVAVDFTASQSVDDLTSGTLPYRIIFPEQVAAASDASDGGTTTDTAPDATGVPADNTTGEN